MDVTFTNVLEGARQYFQGLPAATSAPAGPTYTETVHRSHQHDNTNVVPSTPSSSSAAAANAQFWPPRSQPQNYGQESSPTPQQFQFSRPQSRDTNNVSQYSGQYPSRAPSMTPPSSTNQTYHQLQTSTQQQQQYYHQPNHNTRPYYQQKVVPSSSTAPTTYKVASSQAHATSQENAYYKHLYSPHSSSTTSSTTAPVQYNKTTHNLPQIPQSYHSNRNSRDVIRNTITAKTRPTLTPVAVPKQTIATPANSNRMPNYDAHYQQYQNQRVNHNNSTATPYQHQTVINSSSTATNRVPVVNQYQYSTSTTTTTTAQNYTQVIMTPTSSSSGYSNSINQYYPHGTTTTTTSNTNKIVEAVPQQRYIQTPAVNGRLQAVVPTSTQPHIITKQKRESPLDLSVKTVRTPADSTHDEPDHETRKYYQTTPPTTTVNYPTYDVHANSFQRPTTAPKVEFHPNFGSTLTHEYNNRRAEPKTRPYINQTPQINNRYPTGPVPTAAHVNSYINQTAKRAYDNNLPRMDFPPAGHGHKTAALHPAPSAYDAQKKRPADTAPSSMIPPKMSKVDTWRQNIDQQIEQRLSSYQQQHQKVATISTPPVVPSPIVNGTVYPGQERKEMYAYQNQRPPQQQYPANSYQYPNHNQTFVPSVGAHQYPAYNYPNSYPQMNVPRINSNPSPNQKPNNMGTGGADKRVLSLLRNSLEIKGAQKKLEQQEANFPKHLRLDVQHPSTDVTAPLQPKPIFNRHNNVSPFTPTNLPESAGMLKFHLPKAMDSVNFETESSRYLQPSIEDNQNVDLDGLAAFLAARIRTKAELKQVGPASNNNSGVKLEVVSPPKLCKEGKNAGVLPRRRLFSRNEDDGGLVPHRDKSGMRSSSETSVYDFRESDSEGEMPVLERQSLEDMRRDRRTSIKATDGNEIRVPSPVDDLFTQCCDSFMEQLKSGSGKKRGRRKKVFEAEVLANLEMTISSTSTSSTPLKMKNEEEDDDSDVPLINCAKRKSPKKDEVVVVAKEVVLPRPAKKPNFGDGSDFCPGWEEEVYKYKKSLRMPPGLIQVTRPPQYHRLSTSLPDLDPCPHSPAPSSDKKIKIEQIDSDDSNHCFNLFSTTKNNYDSEGGSSIKSLPNPAKENSILDKLLEKYGGRKKRKIKRKDDTRPKVVPKADKLIELLATPTKDTKSETANDIIQLGFRKKTIDSFKDVFDLKNAKELRSARKNNRMKQRVTIKEVFGEDRPASAPPVTCVNSMKMKGEFADLDDGVSLSNLLKIKREEEDDEVDTKQVLKNRLLNRSNQKDGGSLLKSLMAEKKIKSELLLDCNIEAVENEKNGVIVVGKKRLTKFRRKFSSGFDYIRKKKKSVKKQEVENNAENKQQQQQQQRRSQIANAKSNPGSVQDIQKEIKGWVLNKGIGETILHRSARLGYTDITAYCLENMECSPSPKDNAGYTPLHEASTKGHLGIAKMLLLYGANVSESARGGIRPLHEAVENGYVEIVRLLLSYGADPMLATYAGVTPLALATDETTINLLQNHINDVHGQAAIPWLFPGPAACFDSRESGFDVLAEEPASEASSDDEDVDFEMSESLLPNLYTLAREPRADRWILLQDLSNLLKIKSRDALLRQIASSSGSGGSSSHKSVLRELKMSDFLEQAHCCQFLNIGEKINTRASKIALVKYTDKVRNLLRIEKVTISVR